MSALAIDVRRICRRAWRSHSSDGDEASLDLARESAEQALDHSWTLLDWTRFLWREVRESGAVLGDDLVEERWETFFLECLAPFEQVMRGPREVAPSLRRLEEWREAQARQLAQALHDEAGQLLAAVHLSLEGLRPHLASGGAQHLERAEIALGAAEEELRRIAHELRPAVLDDLGLVAAVRCLGERVGRRAGIAVEVRCPAELQLPAEIETTLYRVAQEGLANAVRHAGASRVTIEIAVSARQVTCRVHDDGRGFDTRAGACAGGLGLQGMRERLHTLRGALEVRSRPGAGTELWARIPLEN